MNEGNNNESPAPENIRSMPPAAAGARGAAGAGAQGAKPGIIGQLKIQQRMFREQLRRVDAALDAFENAPLVAQAFDELSAPVK